MNPWTMLAGALQHLPVSVRRTLYSIVTAAGAVLAVAQLAGWRSLGPIDMDEALKTYALVSSPTGFLALANVKPKDDAYADLGPAYDDDGFDASAFEGSSFEGSSSEEESPANVDESSFS